MSNFFSICHFRVTFIGYNTKNERERYMEILRVEHLTKTYGEREIKTEALNDVSFSVQKGEFVAIIGSSGSGKSTLLHLIAGIDNPTSGKIFIGENDLSTFDSNNITIFRRRQIGLIYQFYNLIPILTVKENIELPILLDNKKVGENKLDEIIKLLKLENKVNSLPNQLSGGQQQRVAIGRAIITNPSIILADEPTGNLDTKNSKEIIDYLKYSNKKYAQTIILVTHDENIALQADRIIKIEDGRIVFDRKNG